LVEDHERALWEAENGSYDHGNMDEHEDGSLLSTI